MFYFREWLKEIWKAYKNPLIVVLGYHLLLKIFLPLQIPDDPKYNCGLRHCPLPPMSPLQSAAYTFGFVLIYVCLFWMVLIYFCRKYEEDGHLD